MKCLKYNETYDETSIQFQNLIELIFPRWQFGCQLVITVVSYKSSPPFQYSIYLGFLTNVHWTIREKDKRYVIVEYEFIGNADFLLVESVPPLVRSSPMKCKPSAKDCWILGACRGTPFYLSLTPMIGEDRGTSEHFVYSLPLKLWNDFRSIRTASREETRLGLRFRYSGMVEKWEVHFEPGQDLDVAIG